MTFATIYWYRANSLLSKLIRAVTRSDYSHVAIYLDGRVYEAVGDGLFCRTGDAADARIARAVAFKTVELDDAAAFHMQRWLDRITDETATTTHPILGDYSVLGFIAAGVGALTGVRIRAGLGNEYICSGLVATALWRTGIDFPWEPATMTPEDLARHFHPNQIAR